MRHFEGGERARESTSAVEIHRFSEPARLLDALSTRHPIWQPRPAEWIFRGQADATWRLLPAAFRTTTGFPSGPALTFRPCKGHGAQLAAELNLIRHFVQCLDHQGLPLPTEHSLKWGNFLLQAQALVEVGGGSRWPPTDATPLFALAQHFGIPTRLLDWSERPTVAAYFAAVDACERMANNEAPDRMLAVWALDFTRAQQVIDVDPSVPRPPTLELTRPPRFTNPNLRAQNGVLTFLIDPTRRDTDTASFPPLDELVQQRSRDGDFTSPLLFRLELPWSKAGSMLRLLADEFVDATQLFPGFGGAARAVREMTFWDKPYHARGR